MKVLVTGGTGYIGSHVTVELLEKGHDVVVIDNLSNSHFKVVEAIGEICGKTPEFHAVDLKNDTKVFDFFEKQNDFDGIIHFAAYKAVGESMEKPLEYYHNNIFALINLLKGMEKHNINNLVFSSSCTVYGEPDKQPVDETAPFKDALSPYGNTKRIAEEIIMDIVKTGKLNCISLRYFNPIGAHDSGLIGELPIGVPNNLIPYLTQTASGKRPYLKVFGNDYDTPDGTPIRDYLHVVDLAKAHVNSLKVLEVNDSKSQFRAFNLGTGKGYSVMEIIKTFEEVTGINLDYRVEPRRAGDITKVWADTQLANKELGWKTERDLRNMLKTAWQWELNLKKTNSNKSASDG